VHILKVSKTAVYNSLKQPAII